jgi:hypothetical protein
VRRDAHLEDFDETNNHRRQRLHVKFKPTARRALPKASALYVSCEGEGNDDGRMRSFRVWQEAEGLSGIISGLNVYTREDIPRLVALIASLRKMPRGRLEPDGVAVA